MNTSARRRLGAILFTGSIAIGAGLQVIGRPFIGYASKVRPMMVCFGVDIHWAVLPVVTVALVGLICWIIPRRCIIPHSL